MTTRWIRWFSAPRGLAALALGLALSGPAAALERGAFSLEVLVDGVPLEEHAARGTTYVEALAGREYSIRLINRTGSRVAVALSVDGLNTIDAKTTTARDAAKWILGPWSTLVLEGWQVDAQRARKFFFTTEERSYGAWLGKTRDLGLVSAAVFRERHREPAPIQRPGELHGRPSRRDEARSEAAPRAPGKESAGPAAGDALAPEPVPSDEHAATGIGRGVEHRVERVRFEAESSPAAVLELRYEYRDALVRLGVLPERHAWREDPLSRRERARGFEDTGFAPDPFRGPRR